MIALAEWIVAAVIVVFAAIPMQQQNSSLTTQTAINGRFWHRMLPAEKLGWVTGYEEGLFVMSLEGTDAEAKSSCTEKMADGLRFNPWRLTPDEISKSIDIFYETPENGPIPVPAAVAYISLKSSGASQSELNDFITKIRKVGLGFVGR